MKNENINGRRVILFDFDGTLVNTTPLILRSFRATWEKTFGFTMNDADYIKTFGTHLPAAMRQLAEQCVAENLVATIDDLGAKAAELLKTYREINWGWHDQHIEAFEGVGEAVRELKARNYRLGIVSSKIRFGVERGLNLFSMAEPFDHIVAADDVANHKPHPEPILKALEHFGVSPDEAIYIGDSTHDIVAGKAAEVATVAAAWGPFPRTELEALNPDHLLDEPRELLRLFGE